MSASTHVPAPRGSLPGPMLAAWAAFGLAGVCMLLLVVPPMMAYRGWKEWRAASAVTSALSDPAFVETASSAGFRVERTDRSGWPTLVARCARSNEAGPLPCGDFPEAPAHPGLRIEVMG